MNTPNTSSTWRESSQPLLPSKISVLSAEYEVYNHIPSHQLDSGKIFHGFPGLLEWIMERKTVIIDGYVGIFFDAIQQQINDLIKERGISVNWIQTADYLRPEAQIDKLVQPYLGATQSVWGTKTNIKLEDLFLPELGLVQPDSASELNVIIGIGATLCGWDAPIVYLDIPKNEIQYRMRAGAITNIGKAEIEAATVMYKRFYFVDWVICDQHRNDILPKIAIIADGQRVDDVNWIYKESLINGLAKLSESVFRVRPWFDKGSWGGQWMKEHIGNLNNEEVNYAWSFELITPENGLVFQSDELLLEVSFDFLMLYQYQAVIGKHADLFGPYFPIRFDFLDTFDGGNLSIQCHPSKKYIQENFGESITQDETYYILDCKPGAKVYLGFQENIDPTEFRDVLEHSQENNEIVDIDRYVQSFPSHKHDLFLIPNGTVHSSGVNNMVLEISATPYIFTFKMYDWLSLDLNGNPRPINIAHAFRNLRFERKGEVVEQEHVSHPVQIAEGVDWKLIHLPTHRDHFYDIHRHEFATNVVVHTNNSCQVLMLVEGTYLELEINGESAGTFAYAETFVIPAATKQYKLINKGSAPAKVVKAFIKENTKL